MSYTPPEMLRISDEDGDELHVEPSFSQPEKRVFAAVNGEGLYLSVKQVKKLRKVLKQWLLDNGHQKIKPWV